MTNDDSVRLSGWAWPNEARKEHYFKNGRSLCGKWGWLGHSDYLLSDSPIGKPCLTCHRRNET